MLFGFVSVKLARQAYVRPSCYVNEIFMQISGTYTPREESWWIFQAPNSPQQKTHLLSACASVFGSLADFEQAFYQTLNSCRILSPPLYNISFAFLSFSPIIT